MKKSMIFIYLLTLITSAWSQQTGTGTVGHKPIPWNEEEVGGGGGRIWGGGSHETEEDKARARSRVIDSMKMSMYRMFVRDSEVKCNGGVRKMSSTDIMESYNLFMLLYGNRKVELQPDPACCTTPDPVKTYFKCIMDDPELLMSLPFALRFKDTFIEAIMEAFPHMSREDAEKMHKFYSDLLEFGTDNSRILN